LVQLKSEKIKQTKCKEKPLNLICKDLSLQSLEENEEGNEEKDS